jgi:prophage antirepressor-like protein
MNEITNYNYAGRDVRTVEKDGDTWWVLKDVCDVLEIANHRDTANRLDDDEKGVVQTDTLGGKQNATIINESGLYNVILRSDKPEAKTFKRWVTHEVLPQIRRTGAYRTEEPTIEQRIKVLEIISAANAETLPYVLQMAKPFMPQENNTAKRVTPESVRLRDIMTQRKLKAQQMADICGVSRISVHRWLASANLPGEAARVKLEKYLGGAL